MKNISLQKIGGLSALYEAAAYILGLVFFLLVVDYTAIVDPLEKVTMLASNQATFYMMYLFVYIIFAVFLVFLALALYERLKYSAPAVAAAATAFALIWAGLVFASGMISNIGAAVVIDLFKQDPQQASLVWMAIEPVADGIGGGNEIVGGLFTLLISWAALRGGVFSRGLNILGLLVGAAGVVSTLPPLAEIGGMIFGLGQIIWFLWLGIAMLRDKQPVQETNAKAVFAG